MSDSIQFSLELPNRTFFTYAVAFPKTCYQTLMWKTKDFLNMDGGEWAVIDRFVSQVSTVIWIYKHNLEDKKEDSKAF